MRPDRLPLHRLAYALTAVLVLSAASPLPAAADTLVIGQLRSKAQTAITIPSGALTLVDLANPATAAGQITSVTVQWSGGGTNPCPSSFKVKFFRPSASGGRLTYLGERGPFASLRGLLAMPISPPMAVQPKDLIGVTELGGAACGGVGNTDTGSGINAALYASDVTSDQSLSDAFNLQRNMVSVQGTGDPPEVRTGIVPVVLSAPGTFGSLFKTAVQMTNPGPNVITGRLVFHPQSKSASADDPALPFQVLGGQTLSFPDIVAALGQTGAGSLDVISTSSPPPLVVTRVFNDGGAAGTSGFTESTVDPADALQQFDSARLVTPDDPSNFRLNVGVRTLSLGAAVVVTLTSMSGAQLTSVNRSYPADYFEQVSATAFLNGLAPGPNQTISITVNSGSLIVYGATADNRTNDSSVQLGNRNDF
ncbi:MAG TPA: hypothetical protein VK780_02880 [Thermoanaerobaculia bacterium]|nr:hypothetical protein [Thermoanaerobaculia bacterium]